MEMMGYGVAEVLIPKENNIIKKSLTLFIKFVKKWSLKLTATKIMNKLSVTYKLISLVIVLVVGILTCYEEGA